MGLVKLILAIKLFPVILLQLSLSKDVYYTLNPHYFCGSPDGVRVCHILGVNGQFPGPTIRAKINDTLHITVRNHIQPGFGETKTTVHWHGLFQRGSPFQDGPDMVTQCPIPRLGSQTYVFKLQQAGTYWWHSHVGSQYTEGMYGPLIINNKPEVYADQYDSEIIITLSDWYHTSGSTNSKWFLSSASAGNEPIPFSNLINGRGKYPCNATQLPCSNNQPTQIFQVTRGKRYRIRVINASAISKFFFSIPNHKLTVIEVDGVDTIKRSFYRVPIAAAQRYSFIVHMNAVGNEHWIVAESDLDMFNFDEPNINPNPQDMIPTVRAKLVYASLILSPKPFPQPPPVPASNDEDGFIEEEMSLEPFDRILAPRTVDQQIVLNVDPVVDAEGVNHLTFNNITYEVGAEPLLGLVLRNKQLPVNANPFSTNFNQVVQIVVNNHDTGPHPFHLHGHTFWVLGIGSTNATDYDPARDKLVLNGPRRDTIIVQTNSWVVLRFVTNNPGVWYFHCHINWHLQSGLAATIIEAPEEARRVLRIPLEAKRICNSVGVQL